MYSRVNIVIFGISILISLSSCLIHSRLDDGRAIGDGSLQIQGSLNVAKTPNLHDVVDGTTNEPITVTIPNVDISLKYGATDKLDVILRGSIYGAANFGVKYQFIGNSTSSFAVAGSIEGVASTFSIGHQEMLYFSFHPTDKFTFFINPRNTSSLIVGSKNIVNYFGGNTGFLIGQKNKFGVEIGVSKYEFGQYRGTHLNGSIGAIFLLKDGSKHKTRKNLN